MKISIVLAGVALATLVGGAANATTLTYDDIGTPGTVYPYYTETGFTELGFQFSNNADVIDISAGSPYSGTGPAVSGNYAALNDYHGPITITKVGGGAFDFNSTYIRSWYGSPTVATISGYDGSTLVGSVTVSNDSIWQDVATNFVGVDSVVIGGGLFLLDNTVINGSAAPEPASWALMILGVGGMGAALRTRRRKAVAA